MGKADKKNKESHAEVTFPSKGLVQGWRRGHTACLSGVYAAFTDKAEKLGEHGS